MRKQSFTELANATGLSVSHISRVMRQKRKPSLHALLLLSKAMKMPVERLIKRLGLKGVGKWGK